ncbi:MAG: DUF1178 family protein [Burkholderiales bacterium]
MLAAMIVYQLHCDADHGFEGWFRSSEDFVLQQRELLIECPECGSRDISRSVSAPHIHAKSGREGSQQLTTIATANRAVRKKLMQFLRDNFRDVGRDFAEKARKMHSQEIPPESIRGEVSRDDFAAMREEGVDIIALSVDLDPPDSVH